LKFVSFSDGVQNGSGEPPNGTGEVRLRIVKT